MEVRSWWPAQRVLIPGHLLDAGRCARFPWLPQRLSNCQREGLVWILALGPACPCLQACHFPPFEASVPLCNGILPLGPQWIDVQNKSRSEPTWKLVPGTILPDWAVLWRMRLPSLPGVPHPHRPRWALHVPPVGSQVQPCDMAAVLGVGRRQGGEGGQLMIVLCYRPPITAL